MTALRIQSLSKVYPADGGADPLRRLVRSLRRTTAGGHHALDDISFSVPKGSALGIVGRNGSGKSTLLRILAGGLRASSGTVEVEGRVGTLLDLTSGINPEFTGAENSLLLGMLAGLTRREVAARMTMIREFSGLGEAFDRPAKSYSAGMTLRLGFSAAIHTDPDILLIDEALAVGDAFFQQRCLRRLREFREQGKTIVLVSHDPSAIIALCDRALWLEHGRIAHEGTPDVVVRHYLAARYRDDCSIEAPLEASQDVSRAPEAAIERADPLAGGEERFGNERARITGISLRDRSGHAIGVASAGERVEVVISALANERLGSPLVGFTLRNRLGDVVTATNTEHADAALLPLAAGEEVSVAFAFEWPSFTGGSYSISPAIADGSIDAHTMCDWVENPLIVQGHNPRGVFGWFSLDDVHARMARSDAPELLPEPLPEPSRESDDTASILGAVERPRAPLIDRDEVTSRRQLFVGGWTFANDGAPVSIRVRVGDEPPTEHTPVGFREDVAQAYPGCSTAGRSGFGLLVDLPERADRARLVVEAAAGDRRQILADRELQLPFIAEPLERPMPSPARRARSGSRGTRRRVLFVSHNLNLEGAPRSLLDVGTRLDPTRFEPALLSPTDGPMLNSWRKQGVPCEVEPISAHGLCVDDYEAAIRRTAALRSGFGPELVVANTLDAFWAVDVASELGVPSIWIVRESESPFSYFYERWPTPIAERATGAFDRATRVLFVSRATEAMFEPVLRAEQSRVIPNGLALGMIDEVRTHATARTIRRTLGLPRKRPVLLCVGTPCQRKGQLVLLQALAKLCGREPAPFCVFVGCRSGPYLDAMQETITTLGLGGSVKLVDETPEPLPYYHCADLLVCPSFQESLPRVILEAMAFGLPVVASSVHGVPELARDGREAYLFRAGDVNALAASIARVLDDDEAAAALGASGRSRVEAHFALDEVVDRYQDLFDEVLDEAETGL